jgi:integrase
MPVYFDKAKGRWRYIFRRRINGERHQATKLLPKGWSQRQAEAYDRLHSGRHYAVADGIERPRLPIAGAVELYLTHRVPKLKNGKKAAQDLEHLAEQIEAGYLDELPQIAADYIRDHPELSEATLHNRLAYLRAAVNYARKKHKYGVGLPDYAGDMDIPIPDNERQVYARLPELNKLWKAFTDPEARALFRLDFYMGLRWRAELLSRRAEHIVRNGPDVWLEIGKTKNGRPVMKPVHPAVVKELRFIPWQHSDGWFYDRWHEAVEKIGREDLKPHDLRHSLASEVLSREGGTLDMVRAALHHQSLQASDRYAHLYPDRMKQILFDVGQKSAHRRKPVTKKKGASY